MTAIVQPITTPIPSTPAVPSAQADITAGQTSLSTTYQSFLTLLTTQLKNQDPTAPLDTNQFTQQLVSLTGVQQQLLSNQLLQQIATSSTGGQGVSGAGGLIGKTVTAQTGAATLSGGQAGWSYSLAAPAATAQLSIADQAGRVVWTGAAPSTAAGLSGFTWNGQDASGRRLAYGGTYTLSVAAADSSGGAVASTVSIKGVVGSVAQSNGQTVVQVGPTSTPLSTITGVSAS